MLRFDERGVRHLLVVNHYFFYYSLPLIFFLALK